MSREFLQQQLDALLDTQMSDKLGREINAHWESLREARRGAQAKQDFAIAALQAELAKPVDLPIRWLCEWRTYEGDLDWEQVADEDPSLTKWDDEPPTVVIPLYACSPTPMGMVLVPFKPTKAMLEAFDNAVGNHDGNAKNEISICNHKT